MTRIVAITGNIGSGKSTVARILEELGALRIDTDELARKVVEPGEPAYREIVAQFGEEVLTPEGTVDRERLGRLVFQDPEKRRLLERITHPRIMEEVQKQVHRAVEAGVAVIVLEIPLLFETGLQRIFPEIVLVTAREEVRRQRLKQRNALPEPEIEKRLASQLPESAKIPGSTWIIENNGDLEELRRKVYALWEELKVGMEKGEGR